MIWPYVMDVSASDEIVRKVSEALKTRGARVIDMSPYLENRPLKELVVSSSDVHPNARIHAEMAEVIFQRLSQDGLKDLPDASTQQPGHPGNDRAKSGEGKDTQFVWRPTGVNSR